LVTVGRFRQYVNYLTSASGAPPANSSGIHTHVNGGLGLVSELSVPSVSDSLFGPPGAPIYETGWDATDWNAQIATGSGAAATWSTNLSCSTSSELISAYGSILPAATWTTVAGSQENLPINCVDWYEAYAFCIWDGGFLPSESEWNYVAAGGSDQRAYPWSPAFPPGAIAIDCSQANYDGCPTGVVHAVGSTSPAGDGKWGQSDLAGNVWEWNLDWNESTYVTPCADCANLTTASFRVIRGGSFGNTPPVLLVSFRDEQDPEYRGDLVGVRCARAP
jgi:sulfatase modifying factor 1